MRTASELLAVFQQLPEASWCFDLAHARQVDPTMIEAREMLRQFGSRLAQLHVSDVNSNSRHEPLSLSALLAFLKIAPLIHRQTPVVIESPVEEPRMRQEMDTVELIFDPRKWIHLPGANYRSSLTKKDKPSNMVELA
ncbi:MAG: hypothetical protein EOP50_21515 [Sphingobacteriales bacterium]|nr:MAG: hypothetical protein EOP50_21515 [Sphingobacteriales bacterium]